MKEQGVAPVSVEPDEIILGQELGDSIWHRNYSRREFGKGTLKVAGAVAVSGSVFTLLEACSDGKEKKSPTPQKTAEPTLSPETETGLPRFLEREPFDRDENTHIQWGFNDPDLTSNDPNKKHEAIDVIHLNPSTKKWESFNIYAPADGLYSKNPPNRIGNAIEGIHKTGGKQFNSYYGHLKEFAPGLPEYGEWKELKAGDLLGVAGADGVVDKDGVPQPDWIHLHWSIELDGKHLDPYDIYGTASQYNEGICGVNTLFKTCPGGLVLGTQTSVAETETQTPQEQATRNPTQETTTEQATANPTQESTEQPQNTETPRPSETENSSESLMQLDNWQVAVVGWDEKKSEMEGWKTVVIKAIARNNGNSVLSGLSLRSDYFQVFSEAGDYYKAYTTGSVEGGYTDQGGIYGILVPPGFGVPFEIVSSVPQASQGYKLVGVTGSVSAEVVKGTVYNGEFPLISPDVDLKKTGETLETSKLNITFKGLSSKYSSGAKIEFVSFDFENKTGQDVGINHLYYFNDHASYGQIGGIEVFLKDGTEMVVYYSSTSDPGSIPPLYKKTVDFELVEDTGGGQYDFGGATVVLIYNDNTWAAWKSEESVQIANETEPKSPEEIKAMVISFMKEAFTVDYRKNVTDQLIESIQAQETGPAKTLAGVEYIKYDWNGFGPETYVYRDMKTGKIFDIDILDGIIVREDVTSSNAANIAQSEFNLPSNITSSSWRSFTEKQGWKILETVWDDTDGTKQSRIVGNSPDGSSWEIGATKLFPGSPGYIQGTTFYDVH